MNDLAVDRFDERQDLAPSFETHLARLARLEPFGVGNPEPVFRIGPCRRVGAGRVFGSGHLGLVAASSTAPRGATVEVVAWQWAERAAADRVFDGDFEMLAAAEHDRFRDRPRLRLVACRAAGPRTN